MLMMNIGAPQNIVSGSAPVDRSAQSTIAADVAPSIYVCRSDSQGKYYSDVPLQQRRAECLQYFKTYAAQLGALRGHKRQVDRLIDLIEKSNQFQLAEEQPDFIALREQFGVTVSGWPSSKDLEFIKAELSKLAELSAEERVESLSKLKSATSVRLFELISTSAQLLDLDESSVDQAMEGYEKLARMCFMLGTTELYTPIDQKKAAVIGRFLRKNNCARVLELNAGSGLWAKALSSDLNGEPIQVIATDSFHLGSANVARYFQKGQLSEDERVTDPQDFQFKDAPQTCFKFKGLNGVEISCTALKPAQVEQLDSIEAVKKYSADVDLVLVVRADYPQIVEALMQLPEDKMILWVGSSPFSETLHQYKEQIGGKDHPVHKSITFNDLSGRLPELKITLPDQNKAAVINLLCAVRLAL